MRVVVVSCWKYHDCWEPFATLLGKYWPNHPYALLITDHHDQWHFLPELDCLDLNRETTNGICDESWCSIVAYFAHCKHGPTFTNDEPFLLMQEDFLLNAPVNQELVEHGLKLMERQAIGAVRLYPCPGATESSDDNYFGPVARHTPYRNSLQATIWRPSYLRAIAERYKTPSEFELEGSEWASSHLKDEVWAFKREVEPWPISYYCSAISRGKWEPAALEFCKQQGIEVDTSMRSIA